MSRLSYNGGEIIGYWANILCSIGFHIWYKPQIATMESFIHNNDRFRNTQAVRISECSVCTKVLIERI